MQEEWVICRIFHKTGEKKNGFLQGHSYLLGPAASFPIITTTSSSSSLPPLLETSTHQKLFMVDHQNHENPDLKYLINTPISQPHELPRTNVFPPSFSVNNSSSLSAAAPSMLIKSLLSSSHQDFTVPKQCKTDANNFSHFQVPPPDDANNLNYWIEKISSNQNPYENPLFLEMGCNFQGSSTAAGKTSATTAHDMSAPVGSQMMLDPPIRIPAGESWPLDL
ncbi:protein CUP-SHAPED COTYLEDON 3 [Tripterygium wilfordii]|uniref:Protein CUP-SHAPED COTYLEDON 3 n=1 Tax=Tripterygium wilfordii TaxID=458696 RepID=A0A7J7DLL4_TRIWF|nr:protein CUP-SHAPED COTYLEDON 3 [Tripterygium wilfordii]